MQIANHTPYPDAEVRRVLERAARATRGALPHRIEVRYRTLPNDTRLGFTPFDHHQPTTLWVEPPYRYPQPGARSWRDELLTSALHEFAHYRHHGPCPGNSCEVAAEAFAQRWRKRLARRTSSGVTHRRPRRAA